MKHAFIQSIEHVLPSGRVNNEQLAALYPGWTAAKIREKTGIDERAVVDDNTFASDLAVEAVNRVLVKSGVDKRVIDLLVLCTQSPDYLLPTTACLVQDRCGLPTTTAALDINLGCSAYPYGLAMIRGMMETGAAHHALLVTAETYSRYIHPLDKSVRTLFGDAASATLLGLHEGDSPPLGPFVLGSDGSGAKNLIVEVGGARRPAGLGDLPSTTDGSGNTRTARNLYMNGPAIFEFTSKRVPDLVTQLLKRSGLGIGDVDYFVFHQASEMMLRHLQRRLVIPDERFPMYFAHCGNTVSSTIPIVLQNLADTGKLTVGARVAVVGFGVGYSWGAGLIRWEAAN